MEILGQITAGGHVRWKNIGLGIISRTIICDGSPVVGKGAISPDKNHKLKTTEENIDEIKGQSNSMVSTGICNPVWICNRFIC